jgi:hypothetical protein
MGFGLVTGFTGLLQSITTINYNSFTDSCTLQFTTAHTRLLSLLCLHQSVLDNGSNTVDSLTCRSMCLLASVCLTAPHNRKSWPLTQSRVSPLLVTTLYRWLVLTEDCLPQNKLKAPVGCPYINSAQTQQRTPPPKAPLLLHV